MEVLSSKQHEIVRSTTLELLVGDCLKVLGIVLSDSRVVFADDLVQTFLNSGSIGRMRHLVFSDLAGVW